jgi:GTP-binding protein
LKAVKRNRDGAKKTERKVAAKEKAVRRGHAAPRPKKKAETSDAAEAKPVRFLTKSARRKRPTQSQARPESKAATNPAADLAFRDATPAVAPNSAPPRRRLPPKAESADHEPLFAICGRPNVGKSTLFNKLTETRRSIVGDEPGITRDRIYGEVRWDGRLARIVDTGGIVPDDEALIPSEIYRQARVALDEADAIVMVVDGRTELTAPDYDLARHLLRGGKPILLAVNKIDTEQLAAQAENYRRLGFQSIFPISAEHSLGIGDLLDAVFEALPIAEPPAPKETETEAAEKEIPTGEDDPNRDLHRTHGEFEQFETKVAIIGRPNVGKSTLLNALTGTSRAIVSPIAGTTRDAVDEVIDYQGDRFRIVDTAGIRRKGKTHEMAEKLSVVMARRHLEAADVALLVIDAQEGVTAADATIGGYAHESGRSIVVVINKWDLVTTARTDGKPPADKAVFEEQVRHALKYLHYAPLIFISASKGNNLKKVLEVAHRVAQQRRKRVTTGQMNRFLEKVDFQRAGVPMAQKIRIYYMTQAAVAPPTFILFANKLVKLHFSFERFLENQVRAAFGFEGSPIWFKVRARNQKGPA